MKISSPYPAHRESLSELRLGAQRSAWLAAQEREAPPRSELLELGSSIGFGRVSGWVGHANVFSRVLGAAEESPCRSSVGRRRMGSRWRQSKASTVVYKLQTSCKTQSWSLAGKSHTERRVDRLKSTLRDMPQPAHHLMASAHNGKNYIFGDSLLATNQRCRGNQRLVHGSTLPAPTHTSVLLLTTSTGCRLCGDDTGQIYVIGGVSSSVGGSTTKPIRGNFRLPTRLLTQVERILKVKQFQIVSKRDRHRCKRQSGHRTRLSLPQTCSLRRYLS